MAVLCTVFIGLRGVARGSFGRREKAADASEGDGLFTAMKNVGCGGVSYFFVMMYGFGGEAFFRIFMRIFSENRIYVEIEVL